MRKRFRKMLVHDKANIYTRQKKRELIKGEYATNYSFFKKCQISRLLWGKCWVFEGIEQSGWYPRRNDLIITTETHLSNNDIHRLNVIANSFNKEIFVEFLWGPKGIGSTITTIIIEVLTEELIKRLLKNIFGNRKCFTIKNIRIKNYNEKQYLEIIDEEENVHEFVIGEKVIDLEYKIEKTIDELHIPYKTEPLKKQDEIYDRRGNKIDYVIEGIKIDIKI
jgi:hypothetical protein